MPKYGKTPWLDYRCEVRLLSYTPHLITANKLVPFDSKHRSQAPMISSINPFFKFITVFYIVKEDCQARKLNTEDAMDHSKWMKLIKDVRWPGLARVGECFFWYRPTRVVPDQRPLNGCVCVCVVCVCILHYTQRREWNRLARVGENHYRAGVILLQVFMYNVYEVCILHGSRHQHITLV